MASDTLSSFLFPPTTLVRRGAKIAVLGGLLDAFLLSITFYNFFRLFNSPTPEWNNTIIAIYIAVIVMRQLGIVFSGILFLGISKNDHKVCRSWFITTAIILIIDSFTYTIYLRSYFNIVTLGECVAISIFRLIELSFVYTFMHHMESLALHKD